MQQQKPKRIFISYRWSLAYPEAKLLQRAIEAHFEDVIVFRDEERSRPGASISRTILSALDDTNLVLAVLHADWQRQPPKSERHSINKLFLEDDWVRMELDYAKNRLGLKVVPILCNGAILPPRNDEDEKMGVLPKCLHFLCDDLLSAKLDYSNASEEHLLQLLEKELGLTKKKQRKEAPRRDRLREEGLEPPWSTRKPCPNSKRPSARPFPPN